MKFSTELINNSIKILIVDKKLLNITKSLKKELEKYDNEVFISSKSPKNLSSFTYSFFINEKLKTEKLTNMQNNKIILTFINDKKTAASYVDFITQYNLKNIKIINLEGSSDINQDNLNLLIWFVFSKSNESFFTITQPVNNTQTYIVRTNRKSFINLNKIFKTRNLITTGILVFVIFLISFIPPLIISSNYFYRAAKSLKENKIIIARSNFDKASFFLRFAKKLYSQSRQIFLFFSIASFPDNLVQINERSEQILHNSLQLSNNGNQISRLIFKKNKTGDEKKLLLSLINISKDNLKTINENVNFLYEKIPVSFPFLSRTKTDLSQLIELSEKAKKFFPFIDYFSINQDEKKYLILFANNMELRPGGGFIGSFGVLKVRDLTLQSIDIYDVYDADGQLIAHVEPPMAIRKYLNQPHWFLRDSAFSPDFLENYNQAVFFLEKEMNIGKFDGGAVITTSMIQNLLEAFGSVYISDYKETITPENFYLKTQIYAEKNFFPGSTQKKSFLNSLSRQLILNLETAQPLLLAKIIKKSLDEKQMAVYFDETDLQKTIDSLYWSGQLIEPSCPPNLGNCYADYFFVVDANLGVNKANFFVNRIINADIILDGQGYINSKISVKFRNDSPNDVFPGGNYKNYFQILIPKNSIVKKITSDDKLIEDYDESEDKLKKIGFIIDVKPKIITEVKIEYRSTIPLIKGKAYYQLLVQKQIGSFNNDLSLKILLPNNVYLLNQNFSPLVKDKQILYNTQLTADKIFFSELLIE